MNSKATVKAETKSEIPRTSAKTPTKTVGAEPEGFTPMLVDPAKMVERFAALTKETAERAFGFFEERGGGVGSELDDWFRAESELLLPVTVDVTETDQQITVTAAVPGFEREDLEVSVKGNSLILSGEAESTEKHEAEQAVITERQSKKFCRQIGLTTEVDANKVTATLKDGVLELALPKIKRSEPAAAAVDNSSS